MRKWIVCAGAQPGMRGREWEREISMMLKRDRVERISQEGQRITNRKTSSVISIYDLDISTTSYQIMVSFMNREPHRDKQFLGKTDFCFGSVPIRHLISPGVQDEISCKGRLWKQISKAGRTWNGRTTQDRVLMGRVGRRYPQRRAGQRWNSRREVVWEQSFKNQ